MSASPLNLDSPLHSAVFGNNCENNFDLPFFPVSGCCFTPLFHNRANEDGFVTDSGGTEYMLSAGHPTSIVNFLKTFQDIPMNIVKFLKTFQDIPMNKPLKSVASNFLTSMFILIHKDTAISHSGFGVKF